MYDYPNNPALGHIMRETWDARTPDDYPTEADPDDRDPGRDRPSGGLPYRLTIDFDDTPVGAELLVSLIEILVRRYALDADVVLETALMPVEVLA